MSGVKNYLGLPYRSMTLQDVNDLVEFTHQPYMYDRQVKKFLRHFEDLSGTMRLCDANKSNQQAISVLRFALQMTAELSEKGSDSTDEILEFAKSVGNVAESECYRGETYLSFFSGDKAPTPTGGTYNKWLDYKVRVSDSYKRALWCDFERMEVSNGYTFCNFFVDACLVDKENKVIPDAFSYEGDCYAFFRMSNYLGKDRDYASVDYIRCKALSGLIDFLGTLHLCEVELRVNGWRISHQTNTVIAQAWRIAFEALSEVTKRNDKYGKRKLRYRVFCCADCKTPRIVKRGKNAARCPLCYNNNTKHHKNRVRNVY